MEGLKACSFIKWQIWQTFTQDDKRNPKIPNKVRDKEGNIDLRQISTKMAGVPKIHQGFGQIFKWDDKKGHVDSWRLGQSLIFANLARSYLQRDDKKGHLDKWRL